MSCKKLGRYFLWANTISWSQRAHVTGAEEIFLQHQFCLDGLLVQLWKCQVIDIGAMTWSLLILQTSTSAYRTVSVPVLGLIRKCVIDPEDPNCCWSEAALVSLILEI